MGQLGGDALDALDAVDHPGGRQVVGAGERHHVPVLAVSVGVARRRRDGLADGLVGVDPFPLEGDVGRVVAHQDVVAGEHEDRNRLEPVVLGGGDVGGDDRIRPGLAASPVPVVHDLHQADISPVVVVVADPRRLVLLAVDGVRDGHRALRHRRKPGEFERPVRAEQHVPGRRAPRGNLTGQRDVDRDLLRGRLDPVAVQVAGEPVLAEAHIGVVPGRRPFTRRIVHELLVVAPVGKIKVQPKQRRQRLLRLGDVLVHERHDQLRPVGQVRVEVPPFVGTR